MCQRHATEYVPYMRETFTDKACPSVGDCVVFPDRASVFYGKRGDNILGCGETLTPPEPRFDISIIS